MRAWSLLAITVMVAGCATSPEVKVASSEVAVSLKELRTAKGALESAYIAELNEIQLLIASSILSDAVNRKVEQLVKQGFDENPIRLSTEIRSAREAAQRRVNMVIVALENAREKPESDFEKFVNDTFKGVVEAARRQADEFESEGAPPKIVDDLRRKAELAENDLSVVIGSEEIDALATLVRLESIKVTVATGLRDLDDYVKFLQLLHKDVNEWVTTDVTVGGDEMATLIDKIVSPGGGQ